MKYFQSFPIITYNNQTLPNILERVKLTDATINDTAIYHPFVINDGERPEKIAYDYYGSTDYVWLIFFANNIIDPYYDWPLSNLEFQDYIIEKYGSIAVAQATPAYYQKLPSTIYVNVNDPRLYYTAINWPGGIPGYVAQTVTSTLRLSPDTTGLDPTVWGSIDSYTA